MGCTGTSPRRARECCEHGGTACRQLPSGAADPLYRDHEERRPSKEESFEKMVERLREVTGQDFGYRPGARPEQLEKVITSWENWWKERASD